MTQTVDPHLQIWKPTREQLLVTALRQLALPVPGMKGLNPSDRVNRLHSELERRRLVAAAALRDDDSD